MNSFKEHFRKFNKAGEFVQKRHEGLGATPASQAKFVPDCHRANQGNQKLELMKRKASGFVSVTMNDIKEIEQEFNIQYNPSIPKKIGNTGITLRFDQKLQTPVLEK